MNKDQVSLELIFDMTSHPGWHALIEDLEERVDAFKEGLAINESTPYQVGLAQGHIKVYREMINLRMILENYFTQLKEDTSVEASDV